MIRKETFIISLAIGCTAAFFLGRQLRPAPAPAASPGPAPQAAATPQPVPPPPAALAAVPDDASGTAVVLSPSKGPDEAKVTLLIISDFECPFCSRVLPTIDKVRETWPDDVRIEFKHNPLGFHQRAMPAALASMAAFRQGRFWEMHDKLFANQKALTDENFTAWARELGLDLAKFDADRNDPALREQILNEQRTAVGVGQGGTPGFLINGRGLSGAQPFTEFERMIRSEIRAADAAMNQGLELIKVHENRTRANLGNRFDVYWAGFVSGAPVKAAPPPPAVERAGPAPRPPVGDVWKAVFTGQEPVKGPADALVTIVEYTDFECPFCSKVVPTLQQITQTWPNDVRIVFRNLPLAFHQRAKPAARAALAAQKQGKFWEMHDKLFANQQALSDADLERYAQEVGLNVAQWKTDFASEAIAARVDADLESASKVNASGTPVFFVNGLKVEGAVPFEKFKAAIDQALAGARGLVARGVARNAVYDEIMKDAKVFKVLDDTKHGLSTSGSPMMGNPDGDITVYEFSDFECPYCSRLGEPLKALINDPAVGSRVKVVFKHFPLEFHHKAPAAHAASMAAHEQGKFWELHDLIFARQNQLSRANLRSWAEELGLDMARYDAFVGGASAMRVVDRDKMEGNRSGVDGTPSLFINGRRFKPLAGYTVESFRETILAEFPAAGSPKAP